MKTHTHLYYLRVVDLVEQIIAMGIIFQINTRLQKSLFIKYTYKHCDPHKSNIKLMRLLCTSRLIYFRVRNQLIRYNFVRHKCQQKKKKQQHTNQPTKPHQ